MSPRKVGPMVEDPFEPRSHDSDAERARKRLLRHHRERLPQLEREYQEATRRVHRLLRLRYGRGSEAG